MPEPACDPADALFGVAACGGELAKDLAGEAAQAMAQTAFGQLALYVGKAAAELFTKALTWWMTTPTAINPDSAVVRDLQGYTHPVVVLILVGSVLAQAIRMMLSRKKDPAIDIGLGLVRYAVATGLSLIVLGAALTAADGLAHALLEPAIKQFVERMDAMFAGLATMNPFILFMVGLVVAALSLIQWLLGFLRQAGILVLATMIPLAASGSINRSTRPWMSKIAGWLVALVAYKPMAAMIYAIGLTFMGSSDDLATAIVGMMVLALAVLALPAMLRFFQWAPLSGGGGGAGGVLAAGALGAMTLSQLGGGGSGNRQAEAMGRSGPQTAPAGSVAPTGSQQALPSGGTAAGGSAGGAAAAAGGSAAAAAGPAGVAATGAIAVGNAARRAPGAAADKMTGEG